MRLDESKTTPKQYFYGMIDSTGSMQGSKHAAAKEGLFQKVEAIKGDFEGIYLWNMFEVGRIQQIKQEDINRLYAGGGNTPLYETIVTICESALRNRSLEDAVIINFFTDGQNTTGVVNRSTAIQLIKDCKARNYVVSFMGTTYDVYRIKNDLQLDEFDVMGYENTGEGVKEAFRNDLASTQRYSKDITRGVKKEDLTNTFYKNI